jgi:tetratricopeptide (TPR) repeat protein
MKLHSAALSAATLFAVLCFAYPLSALTPSAALAQGRIDEAIAMLSPAKDAAAHNLLCRAYYAEEHTDEAIRECEAAVSAAPGDASYHLWLGRAYGLKAGRVGAFNAFGLAKKSRAAMEKAVQLDPHSADALSDLGDFCVEAPGVVGGGMDKANALAQRLLAMDAPRGHRLLGEIAEKQKNYPRALQEFTASATGAHTAAGFVDLGSYYKRRGDKAQVLAAVKNAAAADKARDYSVADAAGLLVETGQASRLAQQLYRSYLDGPSRTEDAPAFRVYTQLGHSLAADGDSAAAQKAYAAALALAKNFVPAQKAAAGK